MWKCGTGTTFLLYLARRSGRIADVRSGVEGGGKPERMPALADAMARRPGWPPEGGDGLPVGGVGVRQVGDGRRFSGRHGL